jgi:hypothetical protein
VAGRWPAVALPGRRGASRLIRVLRRLAFASGLCVLAIGLVLIPVRFCPFALVLHLPCPGCGMGRAALALMRGDVIGALRMHPLSVLIFAWLGWFAGVPLARYVIRATAWDPAANASPKWFERSAFALLVLLIGVWIARFLGFFGGPVPV